MLTLIGLVIIVTLIGSITAHFLLQLSLDKLMEHQLEASKREAKEISNLLSLRIRDGVEKEKIAEGLQQTIEHTGINGNFICLFNNKGIQICHPDPAKIGQVIKHENSIVKNLNQESDQKTFLSILQSGKETGGLREFGDQKIQSEIIYTYPVQEADWIVAAHSNITFHNNEMRQLKTNIILLFIAASTVLIIVSFIVVRVINNKYEREIEHKNEALISELSELSKMNNNLMEQKKELEEKQLNDYPPIIKIDENETITKHRILVTWRDQLIPVSIDQIAYFFTDYSVVRLVCFDKRTYVVNLSLDEIFNRLSTHEYFRTNRQYIVSIKAIDKIYKYGNNQLKIEITPKSNDDIIISKHKVAEFKKWLNV